jgi:hypothetical protein
MSSGMKIVFIIGVVTIVLASAVLIVAMWTQSGPQRKKRRRAGHADGARDTEMMAVRQASEATERRRATDATRDAAKTAEHQANEARRRGEEEARVAAAQEAQRQADETRRRAAEEVRDAAERAEHQANEARRPREEEARVAAEQAAQRQADETRRRAAEEVRDAAERAEHQANEARRRREEEARVAAAQEAQREADETRDGQAETRGAIFEKDKSDGIATRDVGEPLTSVRAPRQYRPTARVPEGPRTAAAATADRQARDRALPIEVRLVFERAGFCRVSLLPRRAAGMPNEMAVTGSGDPPELLVLQDEWYQDVALPNLEYFLREGIEWAGSSPESRRTRWSLSGRELYVLARHSELNGFVSAPRLVLGEEQVVLCVQERLSEIRAAIALTGSPEPTLLNSDSGIPVGWAGLRGVTPRAPMAPSLAGDILDALKPLAAVEIVLEGGIRIDRQTWLSGFPPSVRLRGDTSSIGAVTIDGHDSTLSADGTYAVARWDAPGEHVVWCASDSRTYTMREGAESWESWDAYTWSLGECGVGGTQSRPGICGVLVRPPRIARANGHAIVVPASNPVLIGARPGDIEVCTPRSDVRVGRCVGFPCFEPVWAFPANALHCDKRTARVVLVGSPQPVTASEEQPRARSDARRAHFQRGPSRGIYAWCEAILTAGKKGLKTEPSRTEIADLWEAYKSSARAIRRSRG